MALPRKLKHLNLFNDGNNWQGIVESLTLPKFTRKYEKYRGGGMPGAVDVDLGLDDSALDTEFSIGGTELLLFKQMGKATVDGIQLRFTGSIQRDDTGEVPGRGACGAWTSQRSGFRRVEDGRKQHHQSDQYQQLREADHQW